MKNQKTRVLQSENFGFPIELRRNTRSGFKIVAGCRNFTPTEAIWEVVRATATATRILLSAAGIW